MERPLDLDRLALWRIALRRGLARLTGRSPGRRVGSPSPEGDLMNANGQTRWHLTGHHAGSCNCVWSCPCQFNALPDKGYCEALLAWEVDEGNFGDVSLDGVRFGFAVHWPGPIHEGNGVAQPVVDEGASDEQRDAILAIASGQNGGTYFEIISAVAP